MSGELSLNQYSFGRELSTLYDITVIQWTKLVNTSLIQNRDQYMLVILDIKNTFDLAPWLHIYNSIRSKNTLNYLLGLLWSILKNKILIIPVRKDQTAK